MSKRSRWRMVKALTINNNFILASNSMNIKEMKEWIKYML